MSEQQLVVFSINLYMLMRQLTYIMTLMAYHQYVMPGVFNSVFAKYKTG